MNKYIAGGIVFETSIDFPELLSSDSPTDVYVEYGEVPENLENGNKERVLFDMDESTGEMLFKIPEVARYYIKNDSIRIQLIDEARSEDAQKYIITFLLGLISLRKGFYPLHGGGVVYKGEAYMFTGLSGAGKSTTLAGLQQRGFSVVGDDISNLFMKDGRAYVHPCFPRFKLWDNSLDILEHRNQGEYKLRSDMEKYLVPVENFHADPIPVKRIYHLIENKEGKIEFHEITGKMKIMKLKNNSYKPWMVKSFKLEQKHFGLMMQIAGKVEIVEFSRTKKTSDLEEMFEVLIRDIKRG